MDVAGRIAAGDFDWVIFDLDGTCYSSQAGIEAQLRPAVRAAMARALAVDEAQIPGIREEIFRETGLKETIVGMSERFGIDPHLVYFDAYSKLDLSRLEPYPGLADNLKALAQKQKLCLFTNSYQPFVAKLMEALQIGDCFHAVITAGSNQFLRKPNPGPIRDAVEGHLRSGFSSVVFVDDIPSTLKVVSGLGSTTVLVGNGLVDAPGFVDLHTGENFDSAPSFVDDTTHDIAGYVGACLA